MTSDEDDPKSKVVRSDESHKSRVELFFHLI